MRKLTVLLLVIIMLFAHQALAQNTVTGTVTDANGLPIPGATIKIKNSRAGTTAAANGSFSINAASNAVLIISAVGFETKEVATKGSTTVAVQLGLDTRAIG